MKNRRRTFEICRLLRLIIDVFSSCDWNRKENNCLRFFTHPKPRKSINLCTSSSPFYKWECTGISRKNGNKQNVDACNLSCASRKTEQKCKNKLKIDTISRKKSPKMRVLFLTAASVKHQRQHCQQAVAVDDAEKLSSSAVDAVIACLLIVYIFCVFIVFFSSFSRSCNRLSRGRKSLRTACTGSRTAKAVSPSCRSTLNEAWTRTCDGLTVKFKT